MRLAKEHDYIWLCIDYDSPEVDELKSKNPSIDLGDFVTCCNCGRIMLVNVGTNVCLNVMKNYLYGQIKIYETRVSFDNWR